MFAMSFTRKCLSLLLLCLSGLSAQGQTPSVLTQHNDNLRTGANVRETKLTPANVKSATFGKLFTRTLDANVNGQVLYVPGLTVQGKTHNVIYAYTSNNKNNSPCSLYCFDADDPNASAPLWHTQLPISAQWTTCTPVIDLSTKILYVLTKETNDSGPTKMRAFDITTGSEKPGSPIVVQASVPGTGDGSSGGVVSFDTSHANCRPGLLLVGGVVYCAFAHNSDSFPYHGWILGYKYDGTKFTQTAVFCVNPNGGLDGIWQAGKGLMSDGTNIYCTTGNGSFDIPGGGTSYGMAVLKLRASTLSVMDWFVPFDEKNLSDADLDVGNCGVLGIPGTNRLFTGGTKSGSAYLLDASNLGKFTSGGPDRIVARLDSVSGNDRVGQNPVCWGASALKYVYLWPQGRNLQQYQYDPAVSKFNPAGIFKQTTNLTAGGSLCVTANSSNNGILWAVGYDSVVHAFDATDLSKPELWNSNQNSVRDALPSVGHFQFPMAVNGKVYVPTGSQSIAVYGLFSTAATLAPVADAYVRAGNYVNVNYGSDVQLICKKLSNNSSSTYNRATYLKFDLSGVTAAPSSATLTLTVNSVSNPQGSSENMQVYYVSDSSWNEGTLTWNNAPGLNRTNFTSTGTLVTSKSVPLTPGTVSIDLTSFVGAHLGQIVTLQLIDASAENLFLVFNSKEAGSGPPQLTITP